MGAHPLQAVSAGSNPVRFTKGIEMIFKLPIGDWSGDGHGKCDYFTCEADADSIAEVKEAFDAASQSLPTVLDPRTFCSEYEEYRVPNEVATICDEVGILTNDGWPDGKIFEEGSLGMAEYVIWFINQGNPNLNARMSAINTVPILHYGYHPTSHTSFIGYGLLSY